jgi:molybdate transport system regulatory protein
VESIRTQGLEAEVTFRLKGKDRIVSRITRTGLESLGLAKGEEAYALIKANWITLSPRARAAKPGENALPGRVQAITKAAGKAEVQVELEGGTTLVAMVPEAGAKGWVPGRPVCANFRAADVILGLAR